jgi:hypothetical protein
MKKCKTFKKIESFNSIGFTLDTTISTSRKSMQERSQQATAWDLKKLQQEYTYCIPQCPARKAAPGVHGDLICDLEREGASLTRYSASANQASIDSLVRMPNAGSQ